MFLAIRPENDASSLAEIMPERVSHRGDLIRCNPQAHPAHVQAAPLPLQPLIDVFKVVAQIDLINEAIVSQTEFVAQLLALPVPTCPLRFLSASPRQLGYVGNRDDDASGGELDLFRPRGYQRFDWGHGQRIELLEEIIGNQDVPTLGFDLGFQVPKQDALVRIHRLTLGSACCVNRSSAKAWPELFWSLIANDRANQLGD
jgi:hypothetical protein